MSADAWHRAVPNDCQYRHKEGNTSYIVISFCQHRTSAGSVHTFVSSALNIGPVAPITTKFSLLTGLTAESQHYGKPTSAGRIRYSGSSTDVDLNSKFNLKKKKTGRQFSIDSMTTRTDTPSVPFRTRLMFNWELYCHYHSFVQKKRNTHKCLYVIFRLSTPSCFIYK